MGFLDRLGAVALGFAGAARHTGGLVVDLATAPWNDDDDFNGFFNTLLTRSVVRGGEALSSLMGPDTGFGAAIGGLPEEVRVGPRTAFRELETVSRNVIHEPIATALLAGSLSDSETWSRQRGGAQGPAALLDPDTWRTAYEMSQTTSPGQAFAIAVGTRDLLSESEVNRVTGSDWFNIVSGTLDAATRLFLDADIIMLKAGTVAKARKLDRVLTDARALRRHIDSPQFQRWADNVLKVSEDADLHVASLTATAEQTKAAAKPAVLEARELAKQAAAARRAGAPDEALEDAARAAINKARAARLQADRASKEAASLSPRSVAAERIRNDWFPELEEGSKVGWWLAHAETADEIADVVRIAATGDMRALERVSPVLRNRIERTYYDGGIVKRGDTFTRSEGRFEVRNRDLQVLDDEVADVASSLGDLTVTMPLLGKKAPGAGTLAVLTRGHVDPQMVRDAWRQGRILQDGPLSPAIRWLPDRLFNMLPHSTVALDEVGHAGVQLSRMLRTSGMEQTAIDTWAGRLTAPGLTSTDRWELWQAAENAAWKQVAADYGVKKSVIEDVLSRAQRGRNQARTLTSRRYSAATDPTTGRRIDTMVFEAEDGVTMLPAPFLETQAPNFATTVRFDGVKQTLDRWQQRGWLSKAADEAELATMLADQLSYWWKAGVLLRPAWTARVVLMDEQLRGIAKFGMFEWLLGADPSGAIRFQAGLPLAVRRLAVSMRDEMKISGGRGAVVGAAAGGVLAGGPAGAAVGAGIGWGMARALKMLDDAGYAGFTVDGVKAQGAFGVKGDTAEIFEKTVSSAPQRLEILPVDELGMLSRLKGDPNRFRTVTPMDPGYSQAWARAVNLQLGQSQIGRKLMEEHLRLAEAGTTSRSQAVSEVAAWLTGTTEGRKVWKQIPIRRHFDDAETIRHTVEVAYDTMVKYTGGHNDVIRAALNKNASVDDMRRHFRSADDLPEVHGEALDQMLGQSPMLERIDGLIEKGYKLFGQLPTDTLSRQPAFAAFYRSYMKPRLQSLKDQGRTLTDQELRKLEDAARKQALRDTRALMYDLAERSEFGELNRLVMPFYSAWQEVLTRWAGIALENPDRVARIVKVFNAPNRAGLIYTDDEGEEYVTFRIPEAFRSLVDATPWLRGALDSQGEIRLPKDGFNMVMQGGPGFGPFVQVPVGAAVRERPDLEDAVKFIFPWGAPRSTLDAVMPPAAKRALSIRDKEDDRSYATALGRVLTTRMVKMQLGELDPVDLDDPNARAAFVADAKAEVDAFFRLRAVASLTAPVAPIFDSPYRQHIDMYRQLREADPKTADEKFLDMFGEEFFALTQSMTQLNNGVPATLDGYFTEKDFGDLISRHPEYGSIIVGTDGGGEAVKFSRAMYDRQLTTPVREGSSLMQRSRRAPEEIVTDPDVRLGWSKFSRAMDDIEAERVARGLPNLQVAAADDLRQLKRAIIGKIAGEHPTWWAEYSVVDQQKWTNRLEAFREIAADGRLSGRPDIRGLAEYLEVRDVIVAELQRREFKTLHASANADLAHLWHSIVASIVERNVAFGDLWSRYLERDPLAASDLTAEVA